MAVQRASDAPTARPVLLEPRVAAPNGHDVFTLTSVRAPHDVFTPSSVAELAIIACSAIACGNYHSCALSRDDGVVYTWGEGRYECMLIAC